MITRDNYEEYFLLYADNELSAAGREAVECFVADHPDLREEWEALLQCRVSPDTRVAFPDHEALLKDPLLYYVDGLPFLYPDNSIVFPDKDMLYRTGKDRRVIVLPWLRAGIAAAVIAAVALVFLLTGRGTKTTTSPSVTAQTTTNGNVAKPSATKVSPAVTSILPPALHIAEGTPKITGRPAVRKSIQRQPDQKQDLAVARNTIDDAPGTHNTIDEATGTRNTIRKGIGQRVSTGMDQPGPSVSVADMPVTESLASNVHFAVQTGIPKDQSSFATRALEDEQAGIESENEFGSDQQPPPAKTKLRGIFRKVTRVFAKTADRDNDGNRQVLVGAFQVTLN
jgi:hypothetical protein